MPRRLRALLFGTKDAVPGDYVLMIIAVLGVMVALVVGLWV